MTGNSLRQFIQSSVIGFRFLGWSRQIEILGKSFRRSGILGKPADLVQGTLDMLTLKILAPEPLYGWAISQRLKQISSDVLGVSDGSLCPALHKLEHRGWIGAQWKSSENNRRAKVAWARSKNWGGREGRTSPSLADTNPCLPLKAVPLLRGLPG